MNDVPSSVDFIQAERALRLHSPLGTDVLLPERGRIEEGVNELFEMNVSLRSKQEILPADLIGKLVDLELEVDASRNGGDSVYRPFNALVTDLYGGTRGSRALRSYRITLRPQLWLLSHRTDHRIWMDKTAVDVLETLLLEHGLPAPDTSGLVGKVPQLHYSVQHGESDLDYVRRRLEEVGLFFWFSHEKGAHTMHVVDHASGWLNASKAAQGETRARIALSGSTDRAHIAEWSQHFAYVPGKRAGADWNFETPKLHVKADTPSLVSLPGSAVREIYEYPARTATTGETEQAEKLRMQASEADHERIFGRSNIRFLEVGRKFTPYEQSDSAQSYEEHVVIRSLHEIVDRSYETGSDAPEYHNTFEAIPARVPLTPHRYTRRPKIEGTQVAIVAGPEGEEIHPDKYGRIKLWFPWDRRAKKDGSDTCWVRVSQVWGGGSWGAQVIPRIGMEVMVAFIDGDPDKPLVVGVVPNPDNMPAYDLPVNKTRMVLRSNTHKGTGHNEVAFEDEAGKENLFLHAQKDQTVKVLNNQTSRIDSNALHSVGANHSLEIGSNMSQQVGGGLNMVVGGVGGIVNAIAGGLLGSLAAKSAGLLQQAMSIVSAAAADKPSGADRNADAAGAAVDASASSGDAGTGDLLAQAGGYTGLMASGALSAMAGTMDAVRGGVNDAQAGELRSDAGDAMRGSGAKLGSQVASMIGQGVFNTLISRMQNTSVGVAQTEQVGVAKVVTVGQVYNQTIGHTKRITIGKELFVGVGGGKDKDGNDVPPKSILIMKDDGTIYFKGVRFYVDAEAHIQLIAPMSDNN